MKTREELLKMFEGNKIFFPKDSALENKCRDIYVADILVVLAAPTQEQLNCQYCHPEYPSMSYQGFNYCPHCGRKLGDE